MPSLETIKAQIRALVESFKDKAADGLTWAEVFVFLREALAALMSVVALVDIPGEDKKKLVMQGVSELIDYVLTLVTFPGLPWWLRLLLSYAGPALKPYLLDLVELWLEQAYLLKFKPAA